MLKLISLAGKKEFGEDRRRSHWGQPKMATSSRLGQDIGAHTM
jgi:hypothetical protein